MLYLSFSYSYGFPPSVVEWKLSANLTVKTWEGEWGDCVRIERHNRFFVISMKAWKLLRQSVPLLQTIGYDLKLTPTKNVTVVEFSGERYVSFHSTYIKDNKPMDSHINFNVDEWTEFMSALDVIDRLIPVTGIKPCPNERCTPLKTVTPVSNYEGRMRTSKLSAEQLAEVAEYNRGVEDPRARQCEHCGEACYDGLECHCHQYNCRSCEPANFCDTCGTNKIYAV